MAERRSNQTHRSPRGGGAGRGGGDRRGPAPVEAAARSTARALERHAESLGAKEDVRFACRAVLEGLMATARGSEQPAEVLSLVEQVLHALVVGGAASGNLPLAVRAVVDHALEQRARREAATEMLRLVLRAGYSTAADHLPRRARDDGRFRASALVEALAGAASAYQDDQSWQRMTRG